MEDGFCQFHTKRFRFTYQVNERHPKEVASTSTSNVSHLPSSLFAELNVRVTSVLSIVFCVSPDARV